MLCGCYCYNYCLYCRRCKSGKSLNCLSMSYAGYWLHGTIGGGLGFSVLRGLHTENTTYNIYTISITIIMTTSAFVAFETKFIYKANHLNRNAETTGSVSGHIAVVKRVLTHIGLLFFIDNAVHNWVADRIILILWI